MPSPARAADSKIDKLFDFSGQQYVMVEEHQT